MGRTRTDDARAAPKRGPVLKRLLFSTAAVLLIAACETVTGDPNRIIALRLDATPRDVEARDTLRMSAEALNASGDVVPDAEITWDLLSVDSGQVGFTIDASGLITGNTPGSGSVQARVESLRSDPIPVLVSPAPDSMAPTDSTTISFPAGTTQSDLLGVTVFDSTSVPGQFSPLPGKPVLYRLVVPAPGSPAAADLFLLAADTLPESNPHQATAETDAAGTAAATVNVAPGATPPDTIEVEAIVTTSTGGTVSGSPIRFIVLGSSPF